MPPSAGRCPRAMFKRIPEVAELRRGAREPLMPVRCLGMMMERRREESVAPEPQPDVTHLRAPQVLKSHAYETAAIEAPLHILSD
jgi:hypothetical protein